MLHYSSETKHCFGGRNDCADWSRVNCPDCLKSKPAHFPHCCETMRDHLAIRCCDEHGDHSPDRVVLKSEPWDDDLSEVADRYLLVAQNAAYDFEFCPWCGNRFQDPLSEDGTPLKTGHRRLYITTEG